MSFKSTVKVPLITAQAVHGFNQMVPGLSKVVTIPVIETEEQAIAAATKMVEKNLVRYEYISRLEKVEDTGEGWTVTFHCAGD